MFKKTRVKRHKSIRKHLVGSKDRPRLTVFRSCQHIYAQIIDDSESKTLVAESDIAYDKGTKLEKATTVGENLAKKAKAKKITQVVFDRGGFLYHGRVAALAQGARKGGLKV